MSGAFHLAVYYGAIDSDKAWKSDDNFVRISPSDQNYHRKGNYFVKVTPKWHLMDLFRDNTYTFTIVPVLDQSKSYIGAGTKQSISIGTG